MSEAIHEYDRAIVVRVRKRIYANGDTVSFVVIDFDIPDVAEAVGRLVQAQQALLQEYGTKHDKLNLSNLPDMDELIATMEEDDE